MVVAISGMGISAKVLAEEYSDGILTSTQNDSESPLGVGDVIYSIASPETDYTAGLAWDGQYLWVSGAFSGMIYHFDPWTGDIINQFTGPNYKLRDLAWDGANLWVASWEPQNIYKLDPSNGSVIASFPAPFSGHPDGLSWDGDYLWVGEEEGKIYQVDPSTGLEVYSFSVPYEPGANPRGLAWDGSDIWAGYQTVGLIKKHDINTGDVLTSFGSPSGGVQQGLAWDGQYLWSTGGDNVIYQIDVEFQPPTTSIEGHIIDDNTGAPLDGALLIAINAATKEIIKARSDVDGYYEMPDVEPGIYWVICIKRGYRLGIKRGVEVIAGEATTADFNLIPR